MSRKWSKRGIGVSASSKLSLRFLPQFLLGVGAGVWGRMMASHGERGPGVMCFSYHLANDGFEDNRSEGAEGECRVESNASEADVDNIHRALFNSLPNRRTGIPAVGVLVDTAHGRS